MNVTFTPLQTPTVRPADMPEGVAFETTFVNAPRNVIMRVVKDGAMHEVAPDGEAGVRVGYPKDDYYGPVIRRRDGQPLPDQEPVPLDTLQPWPVWYPDPRVCGRYWQILGDGTVCLSDDARSARSLTSYIPMVLPTLYKAEVQDESE